MSGRGADSLREVLESFAMEGGNRAALLDKYLLLYPQFAEELIDLSIEIASGLHAGRSLTEADERAVDLAWQRMSGGAMSDPWEKAGAARLKAVAQSFPIPIQVLAAIREGRIIFSSIPAWITRKIADGLGASRDAFAAFHMHLGTASAKRSYKADGPPAASPPVTFELALRQAGVPADQIAKLMARNDADGHG
jgi:hypothetical protein